MWRRSSSSSESEVASGAAVLGTRYEDAVKEVLDRDHLAARQHDGVLMLTMHVQSLGSCIYLCRSSRHL
jgi:hypothetical protein